MATLALFELRVRTPAGTRRDPDDVHAFIMEAFMTETIDFDTANVLLKQCKNPGEVVEVEEDDEDYEADKAALEGSDA